jgi:ribosomal protein S12 methylthiotransferase accessory factor
VARALGVTRIARLTGLDRTGVEVASAVRPRGHVLQVTNGKGDSLAQAAAGALAEAAELAAAEAAAADAWGSAAELAARLGAEAVIGPEALEPACPRNSFAPRSGAGEGDGGTGRDEVRQAWRAGRDLASGAPVLVPACAVHVPPSGGPWLGPATVSWTSNGMGAAPEPAAALLHALLEAVERDRVARALPDGFTPGEVERRLLDPGSLPGAAPRTAELVQRIERSGLRVFLLDLTDPTPGLGLRPRLRPGPGRGRGRSRGPGPRPGPGPGDLELPAAAALLLDAEGGPVPVAAGYACRTSLDAALHAALLEAAQSRATEIHGAREDVLLSDRRAAEALRGLLEAVRPARTAGRTRDLAARGAGAATGEVVRRLGRAGVRPVAVDLAGPAGLAVVRVVAPGLLLSELLR